MTARQARTALLHVALVLLAVAWVWPIQWTIGNAIKTSGDIYVSSIGLPADPHFENLTQAWRQGQLDRAMRNSAYVTILTVAMTLLLAIPAGYAIARFSLRWRGLIGLLAILPFVLPTEVVLVPIFLMFKSLGLLNRLEGVAILNTLTGAALGTVILSGFFQRVPREIEDAARVDGAGRFGVLRWVVIPLSSSGIAAVVIFVSVFAWNDYFNGLVLLQKPDVFTVQLAMGNFSNFFQTDQGLLFAALALALAPPLILFVLLQRRFTEGLTAGAVR